MRRIIAIGVFFEPLERRARPDGCHGPGDLLQG
jgi:hypothetical protein